MPPITVTTVLTISYERPRNHRSNACIAFLYFPASLTKHRLFSQRRINHIYQWFLRLLVVCSHLPYVFEGESGADSMHTATDCCNDMESQALVVKLERIIISVIFAVFHFVSNEFPPERGGWFDPHKNWCLMQFTIMFPEEVTKRIVAISTYWNVLSISLTTARLRSWGAAQL